MMMHRGEGGRDGLRSRRGTYGDHLQDISRVIGLRSSVREFLRDERPDAA